ncbi:uncharacterized protein LAJ45_05599 [Morchella importuna]|uniref:uncharacterized protein n=1 Tax=Morchella importuna TaxID=1174673 RepID=UPI001E8EC9F7|nr:uncharacterized protein LAJ45_05599 [Morchella importuna]KAH8150388.1 hypothetical protein LAJ45_05599 [Morchella importuna]
MHFKTLTSSVALLLFSSAINCSPLLEERTDGTGCNADNCLRALRRFSVEAIPFCSAYISVPVITTVVATTTPVITVTSYATITSPVVNRRAAATLAAREEVEVAAESVIFALEEGAGVIERREIAIPSFVSEYPASRISSACSCMPIVTATTSVTSTAPTATATSTATVTVDPRSKCEVAYATSGNGSGNHIENVKASGHLDCCQKCQNKLNCVASAYLGIVGICQHLVNVKTVPYESVSDMCPLGLENYSFGKPSSKGIVYPGPCGF